MSVYNCTFNEYDRLSHALERAEQKAANLESKLAGAERELCMRGRRIRQLESDVKRLERRCIDLDGTIDALHAERMKGFAAVGAATHRAIERDLRIAQLQAAPFYEYCFRNIELTLTFAKPTADEAFAGVECGEKWECKPKGAPGWHYLEKHNGAIWAYWYVGKSNVGDFLHRRAWRGTWYDLRAGEFRRATP